jgi:hypothetical protein
MSTPPAPPQAELLDRPFSFFPAIHGIEHNEWKLKEATWSEMVVVNTKTGEEIGVPRRFVGAVSETGEPVLIVGLTTQLEYRAGSVWPVRRIVLSMPAPPLEPPPGSKAPPDPNEPTGLGAIIGRTGDGTESRISNMIAWSMLAVILVTSLIWALVKFTPEAKPSFVAKDQTFLELNRDDDYWAIVRKLGQPSADRWRPGESELQFRALVYNERGYAVVLFGTKREDVRYIGAMNLNKDGKTWTLLHSVDSARGASNAALLRSLQRF